MYNRHVVVVEDESLLRDLIAKTLESSGFQVTTAANAADAARVFKVADPDAVVLDVELGPGPNGFDFAESLHKTSPDVGIVFLTNLPDSRFVNVDPKALPRRWRARPQRRRAARRWRHRCPTPRPAPRGFPRERAPACRAAGAGRRHSSANHPRRCVTVCAGLPGR